MSDLDFGFSEPVRLPSRERRRVARDLQKELGERIAAREIGVFRRHATAGEREAVELSDGRVVPLSDSEAEFVKQARVWARTGDGPAPALPV